MDMQYDTKKWYQTTFSKRCFYGIAGLYLIGASIMAGMLYTQSHNPQPASFQAIQITRIGSNKQLDIRFEYHDMCPIDSLPINLPTPDPNCSLTCGNCGICAINSRDNTQICACDRFYGTFPLYCEDRSRTCDNVNVDGKIMTVCSCKHSNTISYFYPCGYKKQDRVGGFLASFFGGLVGADWFLFYRGGDGGYIAAGVFKLITLGGLGIWATVDWIRVVASDAAFPDGNNFPLAPWN